MRAIRRAIVPVLLAIAGVAALVEGVRYHKIPVFVEKETTKTIDVPPMPFPGMLPGEPSPPDGSPQGMPFAAPQPTKQTITQIELATLTISEPELIRDVSVGGVVRETAGELAGQLKRTYSGEAGPALCPT
jgi:hypothetical protein